MTRLTDLTTRIATEFNTIVNNKIGALSGLTTSNKTTAVAAINEVNTIASDAASGLTGKADDGSVVKLTGAQSVAGVKTFTDAPVVPDDSFAISKVSGLLSSLDARLRFDAAQSISSAQAKTGRKNLGVLGKYTRIDVVQDHGADNTGATSTVGAVDAAIAAANALGGSVEIYFPPGTYDLKAGLTNKVTVSKVVFKGSGMFSTLLLLQSGTVFGFGNGTNFVFGGGVEDMYLYYPSAPSSDSKVIDMNHVASIKSCRLFVDNVRQLAQLGRSTTGILCSAPYFSHIYGSSDPAAGSIFIDAVQGAALGLSDIIVNAKGVGFPSGSDPHPAEATTFLRFGASAGWDTVHARGVITNRYDTGLDLSCGSGWSVSNMWFTDCVFDYSKSYGIKITCSSGGNLRSVYFNSGWAVASDGYGVYLNRSGGNIINIHFRDFYSRQSGKNNWRFSGTLDKVYVIDCNGMGANRLTGNTGSDQDDMVILGPGVTVRGGHYGESGVSSGLVGQGRYGVNVAPDLSMVRITHVEADGVSGAFAINANTSSSLRRLVTDNFAVSGAPSYASTTTLAAPTSGAVQTNLTPHYVTLYLYGGTVTNVAHNSTTVATSTAGTVTLQLRPGDTWSVTYSAAPTLKQVVRP